MLQKMKFDWLNYYNLTINFNKIIVLLKKSETSRTKLFLIEMAWTKLWVLLNLRDYIINDPNLYVKELVSVSNMLFPTYLYMYCILNLCLYMAGTEKSNCRNILQKCPGKRLRSFCVRRLTMWYSPPSGKQLYNFLTLTFLFYKLK